MFSRKGFPQMFQAFAKFREKHRDAVLYVHTNEYGNDQRGMHLRQCATACGLPRSAVVFTDPFTWELGLSRESVASLYQAFDVFANPAFGEGFGVPIVEAQACGLPVIVTDHSAMTELCGAGWLVDGDPWYDAPQDAFFKCPSIDGIVDALEQAYHAGDMTRQAVEFASAYGADRVTEDYWTDALDNLSRPREVGPLVPVREKAAVA